MTQYNTIKTQIKWDSTPDEMGYYIENLCFLLRNKVVLGGGILENTKIVWFYPLSMAGSRSRNMEEQWKLSYAHYFLGADVKITGVDGLSDTIIDKLKENIIKLPESVAPFLYYKNTTEYKDTIGNLICIDIGGGTTDVAFIDKNDRENTIKYVTSFRFAANSVFGLGEHITPIVSKHKTEIEKTITEKAKRNLLMAFKSIEKDKYADYASFFFSLTNTDEWKDGTQVNFNKLLKDDKKQKLVFVLFYTAIIYHTAQIVKAKELPLPRHIAFSGNGSRIVNIVADKVALAAVAKLIFEKVTGMQYGKNLST
jgi:hypothetical protein